MTKAVLYLRVSTDDQDVANQLPALERMALARGLEITRTFSETMSGSKKSRPELDAMLQAGRRGEFQVILVWAIDRLGRNMSAIVDTVTAMDRVGVAVVSHQEPWLDTQGMVRPLLLSIFAWVAQQERARLIDRTNAGLARARAAGKTLGRPRRAIDIDQALRLRKSGLSVADAARRLGVGAATLHRALQSPNVPASARARQVPA
jgi:putative DNA-invertase from lambdoid prophage Rac